MILEQNEGKVLNESNFDYDAYIFNLNGETAFHKMCDNFKNLDFMLKQYEKLNPAILNLLLLDDVKKEANPLQLAIQNNSHKTVNLILNKLSRVSMNNVHQLKPNFAELIEFNEFSHYLKLCFF